MEIEDVTLEGLDEEICLRGGTPVSTIRGGETVVMTRRLAVVQALESHKGAEDKFKVFDLGMRFEKANGSIVLNDKEVVMAQKAVDSAWPQPGIVVPLARWLEDS